MFILKIIYLKLAKTRKIPLLLSLHFSYNISFTFFSKILLKVPWIYLKIEKVLLQYNHNMIINVNKRRQKERCILTILCYF